MPQILTNESDIRRVIKQPTGYAIYCSLLKTRDPGTWQRVFEPVSANSRPETVLNAPQQRYTVLQNSLMWLARKVGRALRFILAVPDDPYLKTYSSRHPPPTDTVICRSQVGVLGPNIPSRPQNATEKHTSEALPTSQPSTQIEAPPKLSNDTTRVNHNTLFTGMTLTSPLNGRHVRAPRSRGYEQGAYVTMLNPSVGGPAPQSTTAGYGAGKTGRRKADDEESKVTAWPMVDY